MAQPEIIKDIDSRVKIPGDTMTGNLTAPTFIGALNGNASSADKLNTDAGSLRQPIYFNDGKPVIAADNYVFYNEVSGTVPSGNPNSFVLKIGDTMTGNLTAPMFIGSLRGNADTATKLSSTRTISLTGDVTGSGTFDGSGDLSINATVSDNSHSHNLMPAYYLGSMAGPYIYTDSNYNFMVRAGSSTAYKYLNFSSDGKLYVGGVALANVNQLNNYLPLSGGTMTGWMNFATIASWPTPSGETYPINSNGLYWSGSSDWARIFYRVSASDTGNLVVQLGDDTNCNFIVENSAGTVYSTISSQGVSGAVWNDYAEYRSSDPIEPGRVICETGNGTLKLSTERLQPGANVVSDTFGFAIGETENCKTPIAVSGRALVYTYEDRYSYEAGDPVCAAPGGTVSKMSREEVMMYPDRIVGTVSEIPEYERWGTGNVEVKNRIWIKIK